MLNSLELNGFSGAYRDDAAGLAPGRAGGVGWVVVQDLGAAAREKVRTQLDAHPHT